MLDMVARTCRALLKPLCICSGLIALVLSPLLFAKSGVYETPDSFVARHFAGAIPESSFLYPDKALVSKIKSVLGHRYRRFRIRYWLKDERSVWILEEIGKEKPITTGFAVQRNTLKEVKVLIFRESRGWEVRYDSFANQFLDARLTKDMKLSRRIDNITGATLSVRAVTKLARLALLLHNKVTA